MLTNTYRLSMEPGVPDLNVYISQYDVGKTLVFTLVNTATSASISSGVSVEIRGTKPDGHGFSYNQSSVVSYSYSNSTAKVTVHVQGQMTAVAGKVVCEIILYKGTPATTTTPASSDYQQLGTANFYLNVERAALDKDTIRSDSSIRQLIDVVDRTDELLEAAEDIQEAYQDYTSKSVRYDETQELTFNQKATARNNIGALSNNQGSANEGLGLVVGPDGNVVPGEVGLSEAIKTALLNIFRHVAYTDDQGRTYYEELCDAMEVEVGPLIDFITATLELGSHLVYPTDSLNSLKNYLTVLDASDNIVTDYTLEGDISTTGIHTITVSSGDAETTFDVIVSTNDTGILYEWDFTKSLTDERQNVTAILKTGEADEVPGKSEGTTPPVRGDTGVIFNDAQQVLRLLDSDVDTSALLFGKTIQVDVAEFNWAYQEYTYSESTHMRFMVFGDPVGAEGLMTYSTGFGFRKDTSSNNIYWRFLFESRETGNNQTMFDDSLIMSGRNAISGHTIGMYINRNGIGKIYIDGVKQGSAVTALPNDLVGFQIGSGARPKYGGSFYNARITGVRIYDGDVPQ